MVREWKTIEGYSKYQVSNDGFLMQIKNGIILKLHLDKSKLCKDYSRYIVSLKRDDKVMKKHKIHRLVAQAFVPNPDNKLEVDHIDGDPLNNHYTNLRWSTRTEQMANTKMPSNNTSGTKGVSWKKDKKKWKAYCSINKKQHHFGYFDNKEDAEKAVIEGRNKLHGDFARHS